MHHVLRKASGEADMSEDMGNMLVLAFYAAGIITWTIVLFAVHD